jgi:hypothetical protein
MIRRKAINRSASSLFQVGGRARQFYNAFHAAAASSKNDNDWIDPLSAILSPGRSLPDESHQKRRKQPHEKPTDWER